LVSAVLSLGVLLRLVKISQPFVDKWSWRQTDVAMIAQNFYLHGFNIFYPQINWAGNAPGYVGTEFPLVPFLASLLYLLFGVQEWVGRSVSVLFFAASVPPFYLLVKKVANERSALFAAIMYCLAPLGLVAGRSFIPDMASLSLSILALYLFVEWIDRGNDSGLFAAAVVATSLAILVKLPAVIVGLPLLYIAWEAYGARIVQKREIWAFAALSLVAPLAWYVHAYLIRTAHVPHHFFGEGGIEVLNLGSYVSILWTTVTSSLTPVIAVGMIVGLFLPARGRHGLVFHWWLVAIIVFTVIAGRGSLHQWYQLPLVPVAAAFAGAACELGLRKLAKVSGSVAGVEACSVVFGVLACFSYIYAVPLYVPWGLPSWRAGTELSRMTPPGALVIVADNGDPTALYYSRRKGWHFLDRDGVWWGPPASSRQAIRNLEKLRDEGATYLVFTQYTEWWLDYYAEFREHLDSAYRRVRQTSDYVIFELSATGAE
jgi:4-amino-4-deoxy-L-arabinose transferase-like glycosyltransferase